MPHATLSAAAAPARPSYLRPLAPDDLGARLDHTLRVAPRRLQARLCVAAYFFREWSLAEEWGFLSQGDYVRERLGESQATFCDWAYAGRLLAHSSRCRAAWSHGETTLSALSLLGQRCAPREAEAWLLTASETPISRLRTLLRAKTEEHTAGASPSDEASTEVTLRLRLPSSAARYCEDTLELARALSGTAVDDSQALGLVLAEASTEIPAIDPEDRRPMPREFLPHAPRPRRSAPAPGSSSVPGSSSAPDIRPPRDRRSRARRLDRRMRRAQRELVRLSAEFDALLLLAQESGYFAQVGYSNFYDFAQVRLGLPRSTTAERLRAAHLRRCNHPIAVARAQGRLGAVQSYLLRSLERLGVARSALARWIDFASRTTVRMLRRCLSWARNMARTRQRGWWRRDFAPPGFAEVRTSERSLTEMAADPTPPRHQPDPTEPHETVHWRIPAEDHAFFLDLVAGLDHQVRTTVGPRPNPTWTLLRIFHLARHAWSSAARTMPRHPHRAILERDHYRCQVPGCSRRAVEVHHVEFRSRGGSDADDNLLCLCPGHHRRGVHAGRLSITGRVTDDRRHLRFDLGLGPDGRPLLSYLGETAI